MITTIRVYTVLVYAEDHVTHDAYGSREPCTDVHRINDTHRITTANQSDLIKATCSAVTTLAAATLVSTDLKPRILQPQTSPK